MKKIAILVALFVLVGAAFGQAAAVPTLSIDYQFNAVAADDANNFTFYKGPANASGTKDQFDPAKDFVDGITGASKLETTFAFNYYRNDIFGKKVFPGAIRSLMLYPVAGNQTRLDDAFQAVKNADGSIIVRFIHRGTAYQITTDKTGKISFPGFVALNRKVGYIAGEGPQVIAKDFYSDDMVVKVDWAKVWDANVKGGVAIGSSGQKTGDIVQDTATSEIVQYVGALQFAFDGKILTVKGDLQIVKK
jgi:hypothetical protein